MLLASAQYTPFAALTLTVKDINKFPRRSSTAAHPFSQQIAQYQQTGFSPADNCSNSDTQHGGG
jgi:hypothetical protein